MYQRQCHVNAFRCGRGDMAAKHIPQMTTQDPEDREIRRSEPARFAIDYADCRGGTRSRFRIASIWRMYRWNKNLLRY